MQAALPAPTGQQLPSRTEPPTPLRKRMLVAGVALTGASLIAVNPTASIAPAVSELQHRAVELSAATNPLMVWQQTFQTAAEHIQYGLNEISTLYPTLSQDLLGAAPTVLQELGGALTNASGWQQVLGNLPSYAERIQAAIEASQELDPAVPDDIPDFNGMLDNVAGYIQNLQFNYALAEVNQFVLWNLGSGAWPLLKELTIGSEILETLGAHQLANVWDALLLGPDGQGGAITNLTNYVAGPVITSLFQMTEVIDDVAAAVVEQRWEDAATEFLNIGPKTLNAYLNGYTPRVAIENGQDWPWAGILTQGGTLEYFLFTAPKELAWALITPRETELQNGATLSPLRALSEFLRPKSDLVTLDVEASPADTTVVAEGLGKSDSEKSLFSRVNASLTRGSEVLTRDLDVTKTTALSAELEADKTVLVESETEEDVTAPASEEESSTGTTEESTSESEQTEDADNQADSSDKTDDKDSSDKADNTGKTGSNASKKPSSHKSSKANSGKSGASKSSKASSGKSGASKSGKASSGKSGSDK